MKKELIIVLAISAVVLILTNFSLLFNYSQKMNNMTFLGREYMNSQDTYTYLSLIEQSKQKGFLLENQYTSEPQQPWIIRPSYLLIGKVAFFLNLSPIQAYHLFRILFGIIFLAIAYKFIGLFFKKPWERILTLALFTLSTGPGFINYFFIKSDLAISSDLWVPEAFTFLSLKEAPHFILSQILILSGFYFFIKGNENKEKKNYIYSGLSFLLLSFEHAYDTPVIIFTLILTSVLLKRNFKATILILDTMSLGIIYFIVQTKINPILDYFYNQNTVFSPIPQNLLMGYIFLLIPLIIGIEVFLRKKRNNRETLILSWIFCATILLYFPINFQRRLIEGLYFPLIILASTGLIFIFKKIQKYKIKNISYGYLLIFVFVLLTSITSVGSSLKDIQEVESDVPNKYYYHLLDQEVKAIYFLKEKTNFKDVILTNWFYGNLIPGLTGRKVYVGHSVQTYNFDKKIQDLNNFLLDSNEQTGKNFLKKNNIDYIFLGKNDSMLIYGFKPEQRKYLKKIYENKGVSIFRVED